MQVDKTSDIHVTCTDVEALQNDLIEIVIKHKLLIRTFDEETIRLDDIYSQSLHINEVI